MSRPRRRRRRRQRGAPRADASAQPAPGPAASDSAQRGVRGGRRRRRGGGRRGDSAAPASLEEVVRAIRGPMPPELTSPPDGQTLEGIIGDLQSRWGVPQYPQEYRITLKVAEEPKGAPAPLPPPPENGGVAREKAPAAPRMRASTAGDSQVKREKAPRRKRRARRGRRRK